MSPASPRSPCPGAPTACRSASSSSRGVARITCCSPSRPSSSDRSEPSLVRCNVMRAAILLLLAAATAHASPDPCGATALHLAKVTEVAPVIVGTACQIRSTDGMIDKERLHKTFPSVPTVGEPGYGSSELTLPIASAKELAAAVTCEGPPPTIDFAKHRAWV